METTTVFACFPGTEIEEWIGYLNSQIDLGKLSIYVLEAPHVDEVDLVKDHLNTVSDLNHRRLPVFVSCREDILQGLESRGIDYTLIYPNRSEKEAWLRQCKAMDLGEDLLRDLEENWDTWVDVCHASNPKSRITTSAGQSLTELLQVSLPKE